MQLLGHVDEVELCVKNADNISSSIHSAPQAVPFVLLGHLCTHQCVEGLYYDFFKTLEGAFVRQISSNFKQKLSEKNKLFQ